MTISPWITTAKVIIPIEGVCGLLLNAILFVALYKTKMGTEAKLYRVSSMVTAVSGLYISFYTVLFISVPIFVNFTFAAAMYGPALFWLSQRENERLAIAFFTQTHAMWEALFCTSNKSFAQMIPAPSIMQWISLARPSYSTPRRLIYAYALPLMFYINSWYFMQALVPDEKFKAELVDTIYELHGTTLKDYHIYGLRMVNKDGIDFREMMAFDAMPSYCTCYGVFAFCSIQIRTRLRGLGNMASRKTVLMQKRFFRIQIAQVFLPLVLLSPPLGIALFCTLMGANIANASMIMVYTVWMSPSATALLLLAYVGKTFQLRRNQKIEIMKISSTTSMTNVQ